MELNFKDFLLAELFDSSIEYIDWGRSSGNKWQGIFFVPVKGMNPAGAKALREKQRNSDRPYATPPGHVKYMVNIDIGFAPVAWLARRFDGDEFFTVGSAGGGHLLAQVWFKRQTADGSMTFERPGDNDRETDQNLVFGTVKKALEDVMQQSKANITGILFVSHTDADPEDAAKRLKVYKLIARVVAPKWGFIPIQPIADNEKDLLLIKKEFVRQGDQAKYAIPLGKPHNFRWPSSQQPAGLQQQPAPRGIIGHENPVVQGRTP
jgi:hypothetical protein